MIPAISPINSNKNNNYKAKTSFQGPTSAKRIADDIINIEVQLGLDPRSFDYVNYTNGKGEIVTSLKDEMGLGGSGLFKLESKLLKIKNKLQKRLFKELAAQE